MGKRREKGKCDADRIAEIMNKTKKCSSLSSEKRRKCVHKKGGRDKVHYVR